MGTTSGGVIAVSTDPTADAFVVESQAPAVGFLKKAVQPPSQVYIETSDVLTVACATNLNGEGVTFSYRLLRFDGVVIHGQFQLFPTNNRALVTHSEHLAEGFLLSMACKATVATTRGATFVRAFLTKPSLGAGQPSYMLMADYVTTAMSPAYPNGRNLMPSEGPGFVHTDSIATPGPGADWLVSVPTNARWKIKGVQGAFQTNANVATRTVFLSFSQFTVGIFQSVPVATQGPSVSVLYNATPFWVGSSIVATNNYWFMPLDLILTENCLIGSVTANIQGLDQWSSVSLYIEEWLDNV